MIDLQADADPGADPWVLVADWLPADEDPDRPRAVLATTGTDGYPDARTVLVGAADPTGFAFHTHRASRKVAELAAVPRAALVLTWPGATRQLVVRGDAVPDTDASAARVWAARSDHLRRLAWLNDDELAGRDRAGGSPGGRPTSPPVPGPRRRRPGWATGWPRSS